MQYYLLMWFCTCVFTVSTVVVVELAMKNFFSLGRVSHESTKQMHKEFHQALLAMVSVMPDR